MRSSSRVLNKSNASGKTVFIGGSRRVSRLAQEVKHRLDTLMNKRLTVIVGDANGADRAVQRYLARKGYGKVTVFCMAGQCRNNLGDWPTREIVPPSGTARDFAFYSTKDRAMGREADYALMLWDGKSRGTLTNIADLVEQEKPVVVYLAHDKLFLTIRNAEQLKYLAAHGPARVASDGFAGVQFRSSQANPTRMLF